MGFCALLKSALQAVARPQLIVPAALVLVLMPLSPASVHQAAAQGFSISVPGGGSYGGRSFSRFRSSMSHRHGRGTERYDRRGMGMNHPRGNHVNSHYPKTGSHYPRHPRHPRYPRLPSGTAENTYPKGDGHYPRRPRHPRLPRYPSGGSTAGNDYPKGDSHYPRRPRHPRRPPIVVPGGTYVAVPGAPPSAGGGGQPPSTPLVQSGRRPGTGVPPANERRYVPNEVMIEIASGASTQAIDALARRHRLTRLQSFNIQLTGTTFQRLRINDRRPVPQVVRALETDVIVMAAQPNYIARLQATAAATPVCFPANIEHYAPLRMRLEEAQRLATGNRILIGVIDGGVDTGHPELAGMVVSTFDAIRSGDRAHPHGTSIVGAIAARVSLRGIAPGAHLLAARAFGTNRNSMDGTTPNILLSIDWVVQRGGRVINMSFAGAADPAVQRLLAGARERGIVLVAAAGNAGPNSPPLYPAAYPGVIAVTATDENNRIFRFANRGNHVAVAAPGVDLWLPTLDRGCRQTSGTSFAAAQVSGLIALLLERNPSLTPDAVLRALVSTAHDLGPRGTDPMFGAGLVDAYRAVLSVGSGAPAATTGAAASQ